MEFTDYLGIVPKQAEGKELSTFATFKAASAKEAQRCYTIAKSRLLEVNSWEKLVGELSASFQIVDEKGNPELRKVQLGDFLRIDIPGPDNPSGNGFDWVKVEAIKEMNTQIKSVGFTVRPSSAPHFSENKTDHFYDEKTTSTFIVTQKEMEVMACVIDRNMKENDDSKNVVDHIRNWIVGVGAKTIFSRIQWQALADALVKF